MKKEEKNLSYWTTAPTSLEHHNLNAEQYDEGYHNPYWRIYNDVTWSYIQSILPEDIAQTSILDAGVGTGYWSIRLAELGYHVTLADVAEKMLAVAERKIRKEGLQDKIRICLSDITNMVEFEDNIFDVVLAEGDPVSYCSNPDSAVSELSRVVKHKGYVTVSVDNKLNWVARLLSTGEVEKARSLLKTGLGYMGGGDANTGFPAYMFTIEELNGLFEKHKLQPIKNIGKHIYVSRDFNLDNQIVYNQMYELELTYCSLPSIVGRGQHIACVGQKK
jgi:SAM-dependent methyltransferase